MVTRLTPEARSLHLSRRQVLAASAAAALASPFSRSWPAFSHAASSRQSGPIHPWTDAAEIPATLAANASARFRAVADAVKTAMVAHNVPGTALGIIMDGEEEHAVFGVANLATGEPVTPDTRFQIGSVGKTYTGTAIMQLVAAGKLDLYAPVRAYLPDFELEDESVAARLTVYHLLTHTGGFWGDTFFDTGDDDDAIRRLVEEKLPTLPQIAPLGMFPSYNNAGIVLLGRLLEVVEGTTYRDVIQHLQLDPLGMKMSTYDVEEVEQGAYSLGYHSGPDGAELQTPLYLPRSIEPAGLLWSNTREQLRWARLHLADGVAPNGTRLLPAYTAHLMRQAHAPFVGTSSIQMGLTWFVQEVAGVRFAQHIGDTFGQHTTFVIAPDKGFGLVLLTNAEPGGASTAGDVLAAAARSYLDLGDDAAHVGIGRGISFAPDTTPLRLSADDLARFTGRFATPADAVSLRAEDDQLLISMETLDLPGQINPAIPDQVIVDYPVSVIGGDRLAVGSSVIAAFARRPNGEIGWIRIGVRSSPLVSPG